jgi:alpha-galactosidase
MKTALIFLLSFFLFCKVNARTNSNELKNTQESTFDVHHWVELHFAQGKIPPFSFVYGGKSSDSFIKNWKFSIEKLNPTEPNSEVTVFSYSDKQSGFVVRCTVTSFTDFPAVEWVLNFSNKSVKNSSIIEKACAIDYSFASQDTGKFILHHSKGSNAAVNDFQPFDEQMQVGKNIYITPSGGRSSDNTALPFFNIEMPGQQGIVVAVGWTGKWFADVVQKDEKSVSLKSGMENMHLSLHLKEEIRTPKICLLFWKGEDRMIGHNQFRRFILAHHTRKINGRNPELPLSVAF